MKFFATSHTTGLVCLLLGLAASIFIVTNPQGLKNPYANGNGRYADIADSFSEYIVRNTVIRNVTLPGDASILPIITKGYETGDYTFHRDGYHPYFSSLSLQTLPFSVLASLLGSFDDGAFNVTFSVLRFLNALAFSVFIIYFLCKFCRMAGLSTYYYIPIFIICSSGFILFAQNLYFLCATMVAPAALIAWQMSKAQKFSWSAVFLLGLCQFLRQYEFATVFALLTAFSAALFTLGTAAARGRNGLLAFSAIICAFLAAACLHVLIVFADARLSLSLEEAFRTTFQTVRARTLSLSQVPYPFTPDFFAAMDLRWAYPAFRFVGRAVQISERNVLLFMVFLAPLIVFRRRADEVLILLYGFVSYASWYVFAYQHIMLHGMYDPYIFALTIGLSFTFFALIGLDRLGAATGRRWSNWRQGGKAA